MKNNEDLRIGVIGAGGRGHLASYAHKPGEGNRLVAGCDIRDEALAEFRERYGDDTFVTDDYRRLLDRPDIDAVFVTTPDYLHEEHGVAALEAGKAVYLEKPMAITVEGCDRLLRTARATGSRLYLGHNLRHASLVIKMKELIDAGAIGEVKAGWCRHFVAYGGDAYYKTWHSDRRNSTSLLLQKGAHDIDVLHYLCGGYTRLVSGMGNLTVYNQITDRRPEGDLGNASWSNKNWPPLSQKGLSPVIDVEDLSMILMNLDNGVLCTYLQCHYTPDAWRNFTIIGTEGRIENFGNEQPHAEVRVWNRRTKYNPDSDERYVIPPEEGGHGGADPPIVAEFVRFAREGGPTRTSPVAGRESAATGYMGAQSLRNGSMPVEVSALPPDLVAYFDNGQQ